MDLTTLGWDETLARHFEQYEDQGLVPARVLCEHREVYTVMAEAGERSARVLGRLQFAAESRADFPAVGDWAVITPGGDQDVAAIYAVLPRRTMFSRKAILAGGSSDSGGKTDEQVLAANIDLVFLVSGLDNDFNLRRIERFLTVTWDSGSSPVIVLNKADACDDLEARLDDVTAIAVGLPVLVVSAITGDGIEALTEMLTVGKTAALLGSSGVGKSTLINRLIGETRQDTGGVRIDDSKGRHTTTRRELIILPDGGMVIDTPGLRRIQLWGDSAGLNQAFPDIEALFKQCRFSDCKHETEPGCAIRGAIESGELDAKRYQNFRKMQRELHALELRKNVHAQRQESKARGKYYRKFQNEKNDLRKKGLR